MAVLDGRFHLHTLLSETPYSRVYRATHAYTGDDVVVKFIFKEDLFFEELARLYGIDQNPYFCTCLYNYPPSALTKKPFPVEPMHLLASQEEGQTDFDPAETGIIVLESVEGTPLAHQIAQMDARETINSLIEVTYALKVMHETDIIHGNLNADSVWMDPETNDIKIIAFGYDPSKTHYDPTTMNPEHRKGKAPTPESDIYSFAQHFLKQIHRPKFKMRRLIRRCVHEDPSQRPSLAELQKELKSYRRGLNPKRNLEILFGFFKPINFASWVTVVFVASFLMTYIQGEAEVVEQKRYKILNSEGVDYGEKVASLKSLLKESEDEQFREMLAGDIADHYRDTEAIKIMTEADARQPIAVFAFKQQPVIVGREHIFELGDWVEIGDKFGFIAKIEFSRIKLVYEGAFSWHFFDRPSFFIGGAFNSEVAVVWDNEGNLGRLLKVASDLGHIDLDLQGGKSELLDGKVAGLFYSNSPRSFIHALKTIIPMEYENDRIVLEDDGNLMPVYFKIPAIRFEGVALEKLGQYLSNILNCRVEVADAIKLNEIDIDSYNISWQELLSEHNLTWRVLQENQEKVLYIEKDL